MRARDSSVTTSNSGATIASDVKGRASLSTDHRQAQSYLAIDEGPIVVMIENYRSGLLWKLFMHCPEVKNGLIKLGFESPVLKKKVK